MIAFTIILSVVGLAFARGCIINMANGQEAVATFAAVCSFFFFAAAYATV